MQKIGIKKEIRENKTVYVVPALAFNKNNGSKKQRIPHPLGTDSIEFETLEDAVKSIELTGFPYVLPSGEKVVIKEETKPVYLSLEDEIRTSLLKCAKDENYSVCAAAIYSLGEIQDEKYLPIFISMMGEDNEQVRNNAIDALVNYANIDANIVANLTIEAMSDENWVRRKSAITVVEKLVQSTNVPAEMFFSPLLAMFNDSNTIPKSAAIMAVGKLYKLYKS